jgi:hypothetical protein
MDTMLHAERIRKRARVGRQVVGGREITMLVEFRNCDRLFELCDVPQELHYRQEIRKCNGDDDVDLCILRMRY